MKIIRFIFLFFCASISLAQNDSIIIIDSDSFTEVADDGYKNQPMTENYLMEKSPIRAALYSTILPGAGQIYNKKWWKAPIVWGVLAVGTGFIIYYNDEHNKYRDAYLDKLYGRPSKYDFMTKEQLGRIQDDRKRTRDYAIALTVVGYLLNILDATVDAHLHGIKKDPDLSLSPIIMHDYSDFEPKLGISLNLKL